MSQLFFVVMLILSGLGLSSQAAINGGLGKNTGAMEAALISFLIGSIGLILLVLFFGKGNLLEVFKVPKWQLLGGLLGAIYISILAYAVPKVGVSISVISVICGQMTMSMLIDHYGWFQSQRLPINGYRVMGVMLLLAAVVFIYRGSTVNK
ncbi:DMT family transporter [Paenibacillus eucommiae]|uniref:Transporter family-2 protein n=1 Tax=Paenibacillus eucommiae TaxID=1355755 RepID=A0ABS4IP91_9BACL|nr:DMT family transporter [Paenibacillus eucommiae]MBP1989330.1 transporter family-2 protein [Paenibacillus eucommiae]